MSLVTRCGYCATTFRVSPAQLSARAGRVRCGKCAAIFDGVANLLAQEAVAALPHEPSPQMGLFAAPDGDTEPQASVASLPQASVATLPPASDALDAQASFSKDGHQPGTANSAAGHAIAAVSIASPLAQLPRAELGSAVPTANLAAPSAEPEPEPVARFLQTHPRNSYTLLWSLFSLLALLALLAQALMHMRTEIAVLLPQARMHLATACEMLGCELKLPRRAELMSIESSDLQADTRRAGVIVLNALLRNRAPFEQEFPELELTLTDERDEPLIRKVLRPADYLQERRFAGAQSIGAGAEEPVRVSFDTGRVRATGYRLYLFYR